MYYHILLTHRYLDEWEVESHDFQVGDLSEALKIASEWVADSGLSFARRTARVERWPDDDEDGNPDCDEMTVATMDVEVARWRDTRSS